MRRVLHGFIGFYRTLGGLVREVQHFCTYVIDRNGVRSPSEANALRINQAPMLKRSGNWALSHTKQDLKSRGVSEHMSLPT